MRYHRISTTSRRFAHVRRFPSCSPSPPPSPPIPCIPLWDGKAPHAVGDSDADKPSLTVFNRAEKPNGTAVVDLPRRRVRLPRRRPRGQAGRRVPQRASASPRSCSSTASWRRTVPARSSRPARRRPAGHPAGPVPCQGLRHRPEASRHLGLLGRRAPRQLRRPRTSTTAVDPRPRRDRRMSCRPDFAILAYPVISMEDGVTHGGSKKNLLGDKPGREAGRNSCRTRSR